MSSRSRFARVVALVAVGFLLMFVCHFLAFAGWMATEGLSRRLPYWWGYLLVYPMAGVVVARLALLEAWPAAACLGAAPVIYFLSLGLLEGAWSASDAALGGALLATAITGLVGGRIRPAKGRAA